MYLNFYKPLQILNKYFYYQSFSKKNTETFFN